MKKLFTFVLAVALVLGIVASPVVAEAANQGERDSHGNIVPQGREEVDRSKPRPRGWETFPHNYEEAKAQGYSKRIGLRVNRNNVVFYWVRETEIVPKGQQPLQTVNEYKLHTDVVGTTPDKDYGEAATAVMVPAHRYIYDDGDFVPPSEGYNPETDMIAPYRGLPPYDSLPVPAYSFEDHALRNKYFSKVGKAEIGTFWGARDKNGEVYYCINPNSVDPVENTQYFQLNPKYDYQSNYREVPETAYLLATLLQNANFFNLDGSPNWARGFDNLVKEFNRMVADLNNTDSVEPGALDGRITMGELRDAFKTLMGDKGNVEFAGETMRPQKDANGTQALPTDVSDSGYDKKSDILVLGFEYPVGHYMQGIPMAEADQWFGRKGMWDFGNDGYVESRTRYGRAFARMLVAYTELAKNKHLLGHDNFSYQDIDLQLRDKQQQGGKTIGTFQINDLEAEGVSGYSIVIPAELQGKVRVTEPRDILEISGAYAFAPQSLRNGFKVEIEPGVTSAQLQSIQLTRHYRDKTLALAYSSKKNYRYDQKTGRWFIREMVAADKEGYIGGTEQRKHGLGYGQELIKFSRSKNLVTKSISLNVDQPIYGIKTTVSAEVPGKGMQAASDKAALTAEYPSEQFKSGIHLKDTVAYKGLKPDKQYKLIAVLNEVTKDTGAVKPVIAKVGEAFSPNPSVSDSNYVPEVKTEVDFGLVKDLEPGKTYVVYEYLFGADTPLDTQGDAKDITSSDKEKALATHQNPLDTAQSFQPTEPLSIKTVAYLKVDEHSSVDKAPDVAEGQEPQILEKKVTPEQLAKGITVVDRVNYTGLDSGVRYRLIAFLNEVVDSNTVKPVKTTISQSFAADPSKKTVLVNFGAVKGLKANTRYVIYEYLFKDNPNFIESYQKQQDDPAANIIELDLEKIESVAESLGVASHTDSTEKSQTFLLSEPELKTTVRAGNSQGSEKQEARVEAGETTVVDTVSFKGLDPKTVYILKAELIEIKEDDNQTIQTVYHPFTPGEASGSEEVSFAPVTLQAGKKYVVFESAIKLEDADKDSAGNYNAKATKSWIEHKDPEDKAQTVVVEKPSPEDPKGSLRTTVSVNGVRASALAPVLVDPVGSVTAVDRIDYAGLVKGQEYTFSGRLMEIRSGQDPVVVASAEVKKVVEAAEGSVDVSFDGVKLEAGKTYVVFETATSKDKLVENNSKPHVVKHENPDDKSQTIRVKESPIPAIPPKWSLPETGTYSYAVLGFALTAIVLGGLFRVRRKQRK